jgi:peroxiredoxin
MKKINKFVLFIVIGLTAIFFGKKFNEQPIEQLSNIEATNAFYSTQLTNIDKKIISLSQYKNKWLLINFWATWCEPCREEIPELNNFFHKNDNNITLIGIAIDELELVKKFNKEVPIHYTSLISDMTGVALSRTLGNEKGVLPFSVVIDPNGKIRNVFYGKVTSEALNNIVISFVN